MNFRELIEQIKQKRVSGVVSVDDVISEKEAAPVDDEIVKEPIVKQVRNTRKGRNK